MQTHAHLSRPVDPNRLDVCSRSAPADSSARSCIWRPIYHFHSVADRLVMLQFITFIADRLDGGRG
jgi:hypothetical protein